MNNTPDRRSKPRITCDYPVIFEGYDSAGNKYCENAQLANLSASGLLMKINRNIGNGTRLAVTVLLTCTSIAIDTPKIATNGIVVRTKPQADGSFAAAIKFIRYRFL